MRRGLIALAVLAAAGFITAAVVIRSHEVRGASMAAAAPLPAGVEVDRRPAPVALRDSDGRRVSLEDWRGRWIVLAPFLTQCQEVCPITTGALLELRSRLRATGLGDKVTLVEASVDPWRDHPAQLRAYRRLSGPGIELLTGSRAALRRFWSFFGIGFEPLGRPGAAGFDVAHNDGVFLLDPNGRERVAIDADPAVGGRLPRPLLARLDAEGRENLRHPGQSWNAQQVLADLHSLGGLPVGPAPPSAAAARRALAGSPAPLAALHRDAGDLLEGESLEDALTRLRGYPVVVNGWAAWCPPCREELPLFARAALRHGRDVAFLGADVDDDAGNARKLLSETRLPYPSVPASAADLSSLAPVHGTPTTYYVDPDGDLAGVHIGAYDSLSSLEADIARYTHSG
jgi:cytochrome oxidase Cu insertion factor (SCO1/SenC/PrrC family)/thiol-disulfide isomerase/thioredoxin